MPLRPIDSIVTSAENLTDKQFKELIADLHAVAIQEKVRQKQMREYLRKDYQIGLRVTAEEYQYIKKQADKMQVSMSAIVRYMLVKCIKDIEML